MANISQKVNLTPNQRMDIAEFMAMQTNLENAVTRLVQLIGSPIIDPVTNIQWNVNGVLTSSTITVSGADLVIGSGLEVMCKDGHIITQDANYTMTGVLPLGATKALMAKPLAETPALPDNRRFWDNGTTQEVNGTPNTILTRQLDFAFVPNTAADIEDAVNNSDYVFIATVSSDGSTVVWQNAFPDSGTLQLPSLLAIVKRLIGTDNENSGLYSASCGGQDNTNSGIDSASSGGDDNTNSGIDSASSGGYSNTNSGDYSASSAGEQNTNSGDYSASSGGRYNTNSGNYSASSGGSSNTNSGIRSASSGGGSNTNSGDYSASCGGTSNTNSGQHSISIGGVKNTNGGLQSVILGQYCENATDDVICGGYNTTLTPSGANQNLKWVLSNRHGTAHFASDVKIGGNVNDGTGATFMVLGTSGSFQAEGNAYFGGDVDLTADPKAKIIGATGKAHIGGDVEIGGTVTAGATASTAPTVVIAASSGNIHAEGDVKIGGDATAGTNVKFQVTGTTGAIGHAIETATATVDWQPAGPLDQTVSANAVVTTANDRPMVEITVTFTNTNASTFPLNQGGAFLLDLSGVASIGTLINAFAHTTSGTTTDEKKVRWSCGMILDPADANKPKLAVSSVGNHMAGYPSAVEIAQNDVITVKVYLQYATLTHI